MSVATVYEVLLVLSAVCVAAGYPWMAAAELVVVLMLNATVFKRKFVRGEYRIATRGCCAKKIKAALTTAQKMTEACAPVVKEAGMGTFRAEGDDVFLLRKDEEPSCAVVYGFRWEGAHEFRYNVDWFLQGRDKPMTFTCEYVNKLEETGDEKVLWKRRVQFDQRANLTAPMWLGTQSRGNAQFHASELRALAQMVGCEITQ